MPIAVSVVTLTTYFHLGHFRMIAPFVEAADRRRALQIVKVDAVELCVMTQNPFGDQWHRASSALALYSIRGALGLPRNAPHNID